MKKHTQKIEIYKQEHFNSQFWEEISTCVAGHMRYVMDTCDHVQSIILLPRMVGKSFMLVALRKLNVNKAECQ